MLERKKAMKAMKSLTRKDTLSNPVGSCLDCVEKHLSMGMILWGEMHLGYPENRWAIIGNLALAEMESYERFQFLADEIRKARLGYQLRGEKVDWVNLLAFARQLKEWQNKAKKGKNDGKE